MNAPNPAVRGGRTLVFETNELWGEVVRFYLEYGFNNHY
jgi:hypothetical protein